MVAQGVARQRLQLGPVAMHSLRQWTEKYDDVWKYGYSRVPQDLPQNVSVEEKKRPLPSCTRIAEYFGRSVSANTNANNTKASAGKKVVTFASASGAQAKKAIPATPAAHATTLPPVAATTTIASVHYPLRSPAAASFTKPSSSSGQGSEQQYHGRAKYAIPIGPGSISSESSSPSPPPRSLPPPTPYPHLQIRGQDQSATPAVALFEPGSASEGSRSMSISSVSHEVKGDQDKEASDDKDRDLLAQLQLGNRNRGSYSRGYHDDADGFYGRPGAYDVIDLTETTGKGKGKKRSAADASPYPFDMFSSKKRRRPSSFGGGSYADNSFYDNNYGNYDNYNDDYDDDFSEKENIINNDDMLLNKFGHVQSVDPVPVGTGGDKNNSRAVQPQSAFKPYSVLVSGSVTSPGTARKSVRFDFGDDERSTTSAGANRSARSRRDSGSSSGGGPSPGMRSGARRALGRYELTASRRGELGPYR
ncbi:hypothetical protein F4808DRAFT_426153 [Astrocystis sublimbata]|nr:hypothetical protein F4808DRAFT_426153 [Astrocystis sublimbata]